MLNCRLFFLSLILVFLVTSSGVAKAQQISRGQVEAYLKDPFEKYGDGTSTFWEDRMYRLLAANRDPEETARVLAQKDGLSVADERALIALWMAHAEVRDDIGAPENPVKYESRRQSVNRRAIDAVRASRHNPFFLRIAVRILTWDERCDLGSFDALLSGAPDILAAGVAAAEEASCTSWWLSLHARFPGNAAILAELSDSPEDLTPSERLALLEHLNAAPESAQESRVGLKLRYISELWRAGLIAEGLAVIDSLPDPDRQFLLNDEPLPGSIVLDGISVAINGGDRGKPFAGRQNDFRLEYVAALQLAGRGDEARRVFDGLPYTPQMRSLWNCLANDGVRASKEPQDPCNATASALTWRWWLLESVLNHQDEDPYLLAEAAFAGGLREFRTIDSGSALWVEVTRMRFTGDNYEGVRAGLAELFSSQNTHERKPDVTAAVTRFMNDEFRQATAAYERKIRTTLAEWKVTSSVESTTDRRANATPPPLPAGFRQLSMPQNVRTKRTRKEESQRWPAGVAPLPSGFSPVRVERGADVAVAVSLSQNLDPVGEVSEGGYWVHLSRDRGASWGEPLYTGLPEYFPYVVPPVSKMPLWAGDRINLEVEIQELDPSSITYPPVGLRSRRRDTNLYLEIPIAALESDRDHDGLTDIVEEHLLLNPAAADSDGDGIRDGRDPLPNVNSAGGRRDANDPIAQILQEIFNTPLDAIVEPVDRDTGPDALFQGTFAGQPSRFRPLFVHGRPEDFKSGVVGAPMLVYSDADLEKLRTRTPDFHALTLGPVVFNRANDRGYAIWSLGWTGGTLRLIREGNAWHIEVVSHWIS